MSPHLIDAFCAVQTLIISFLGLTTAVYLVGWLVTESLSSAITWHCIILAAGCACLVVLSYTFTFTLGMVIDSG